MNLIAINRNTPLEIKRDPGYYLKFIDLTFLPGNLAYNLIIPVLFNPFIFIFLRNKFGLDSIINYIVSIFINFILSWVLFYIGCKREKKFYQ